MDTTNFDLNDRVYRRVRDGAPVDFVHVRVDEEHSDVFYLTNSHRGFVTESPTITGSAEKFTMEFPELPFSYELRELTLADVQEFYEGSVRTFDSVENGEKYIRRDLLSNDYSEKVDTPFAGLTVTLSEDGEALELTREDEEGNLFYRDNEDWTEVTDPDEMPTIFDKRFISIEPEDSDAIVALWDESLEDGTELFEEDIRPFAAFIQ